MGNKTTEKKNIEKRKRKTIIEKKSNDNNNCFLLLLFYMENTFLHAAGYWKCRYVEFDSNGLLFLFKHIYIYIYIYIHIYIYIFQRSNFNLEKTKSFVKENFCSTNTRNWVYLLRNCFSNYVYLKDVYINFKTIGKIMEKYGC